MDEPIKQKKPEQQEKQLEQEKQQEKEQPSAPVFIQPLPSQIKVNEAKEVELSVTVQGTLLGKPFVFKYLFLLRTKLQSSYSVNIFMDSLKFKIIF